MTTYHVRPPDHDHPPLSGREDALPGRVQGPAWTLAGAMVRRHGLSMSIAYQTPDPDLIAAATRYAEAGCLACAQAIAPPEPEWDAREPQADYAEGAAEAHEGWTCHLGHPTTPPIHYGEACWRLCPTCEADYIERGSDYVAVESGVIITTGCDHTPTVELPPSPVIIMRALARR